MVMNQKLLLSIRSFTTILLLPLFLVLLCPLQSIAASACLVGTPRIVIDGYNLDITCSVNYKGCKGQEVYWGVTFYENPNGPAMTDDEGNTLSLYPNFAYQAPGGRVPHNNRLFPGYDDCYYNDYNMRMNLMRFFEKGRKYYFRFFYVMDYLRPKSYPEELVLYRIVNLGTSELFEFSY